MRWLLCMAGLWPVTAFEAGADMIDTSGMQAWEVCAMCHGVDGNSRMAKFPRLAAQPYAYLIKQLADFKAGRRANDGGQMSAIAEQLSPETIDAVARYFSGQDQAAGRAAPDRPGAVGIGGMLFHRGVEARGIPACASCHSSDAPAGSAVARLEGQHAAYLMKQLRDFRSGARSNDATGRMRDVAAALRDFEIEAVSLYAANVRPSERRAP